MRVLTLSFALSWIACCATVSTAQPLDSVRVVRLESGAVGFWIPRAAAADYRHLLVEVLPRYEDVLRRYRMRAVQDSVLLERQAERLSLLEANVRDLEALRATLEEEVRRREQIAALNRRLRHRERWWKVGAVAGGAALLVAALAR